MKAATLQELSDLFSPVPPNPTYMDTVNRSYIRYHEEPVAHTNWLPWAIVATVFGFCTSCIGSVLGIIGIVYANKANDLYNRGNRAEGKSNNNTARTCTIIGLVLAAAGLIFSIIMLQIGMFGDYCRIFDNLD